MKSVYNFIVEPLGSRYKNTVSVGNKELIINSEIQNHQYVNRYAKVLSVPIYAESLGIKVGDTVIVHHNVFRRWYDVRGREKNSKSFFKDNKFIISQDQIFLYKNKDNWKPLEGFCFVQPIKSEDKFNKDVEHETKGIVKYTDGSLEVGQVVGFEPFSKYEFIIDGEKLYRVYSKYITIKYEYQGNEETYNPSWAQSG
jgi:hypothetical protein